MWNKKVEDTTGVCSIIMFTLHEGNIDLELLPFSSVISLIDNSGFVLFRLSLPLAIKNKKQFIHDKFLVSRRLYTISPYIFYLQWHMEL